MKKIPEKGFYDDSFAGYTLMGVYRNGENIPTGWLTACPYKGGRKNGDSDNPSSDPHTYFYKGFGDADCIDYLFELGLVT